MFAYVRLCSLNWKKNCRGATSGVQRPIRPDKAKNSEDKVYFVLGRQVSADYVHASIIPLRARPTLIGDRHSSGSSKVCSHQVLPWKPGRRAAPNPDAPERPKTSSAVAWGGWAMALGLIVALPAAAAGRLDWQTAPGYRWRELPVPAVGKTGFTLLPPHSTGI